MFLIGLIVKAKKMGGMQINRAAGLLAANGPQPSRETEKAMKHTYQQAC